ncbi:MAG: TonB-dependent receptor plug domain-containing protein, partial [candidate division WOR-3 bacterium]
MLLSLLCALTMLGNPRSGLPPGDTTPSADSTSIVRLSDVVTVATRIPREFRRVGLSTSCIRLDPAVWAQQELPTALARIRGLDIRPYGPGAGLAAISVWGSTSQQTLILVDGHPTTNGFSGTTDPGLLRLTNVTDIEVARGAASSLYGSNALGGVVQLLTFRPREQAPGTMRQSYQLGVGLPSRSLVAPASLPSGLGNNVSYGATGRYGPIGLRLDLAAHRKQGSRTNETSDGLSGTGGISYFSGQELELDLSISSSRRKLGLPGPKPDLSLLPRFGDSLATSRFDRENDELTTIRGDLHHHLATHAGELTLDIKPDHTWSVTKYQTLLPYAADTTEIKTDCYRSRTSNNSLPLRFVPVPRAQLTIGHD